MPLRRSRPNRRECLTLSQKRNSRKRSKNGEDGGTGVYMQEGTTSRVTAVDRPYVEFYDFHSVSPENFGSTLVSTTRVSETVESLSPHPLHSEKGKKCLPDKRMYVKKQVGDRVVCWVLESQVRTC